MQVAAIGHINNNQITTYKLNSDLHNLKWQKSFLGNPQKAFESKNSIIKMFRNIFKNFNGTPCAYCNVKTIHENVYKSIDWSEGTKIVIKENSSNFKNLPFMKGNKKQNRIIIILKKFEKNMHPVEKSVFDLLKKASDKHPEKTLTELVIDLRPKYMKELRKIQMGIIKKIQLAADILPPNEKETLSRMIESAIKAICDKDDKLHFKRKIFLNDMLTFSKTTSNKIVGDKMVNLARKLPTSGDNLAAFITKYSGKVEKKDIKGNSYYEYRSSKEIGQRLIGGSVGNVDHIKAKSKLGANEFSNFIYTCEKCNSKKNDDSLFDIMKTFSNLAKNIQMHYDYLISRINKGQSKNIAGYIIDSKKTILEESNNEINVDISKLKINTQEIIKNFKPILDAFNEGKLKKHVN